MVGMDQVVCQECAEVVFIDHSMVYDRLVLRFRPGEPVPVWVSSKVLSTLANRPKLSKMNKSCCVEFCATGNSVRTA